MCTPATPRWVAEGCWLHKTWSKWGLLDDVGDPAGFLGWKHQSCLDYWLFDVFWWILAVLWALLLRRMMLVHRWVLAWDSFKEQSEQTVAKKYCACRKQNPRMRGFRPCLPLFPGSAIMSRKLAVKTGSSSKHGQSNGKNDGLSNGKVKTPKTKQT